MIRYGTIFWRAELRRPPGTAGRDPYSQNGAWPLRSRAGLRASRTVATTWRAACSAHAQCSPRRTAPGTHLFGRRGGVTSPGARLRQRSRRNGSDCWQTPSAMSSPSVAVPQREPLPSGPWTAVGPASRSSAAAPQKSPSTVASQRPD